MPVAKSELWVTPDGAQWRVSRPATGEILGEFAGREEAVQEARKIAQREAATLIRLETENGTSEAVPLLGKDPATEVG